VLFPLAGAAGSWDAAKKTWTLTPAGPPPLSVEVAVVHVAPTTQVVLRLTAAARTAVNGGVIAARCPACGAELRLALDGTCAHCKASVTNGSVDWVVVDVQPAAYVGYSADSSLGIAASSIPDGVATLTAADKDFSLGVFEGRVKTAFLALQDAWCKQTLDAGRAFMSPGAYFTWSTQLETMTAEGRRNVMENVSVRGIEPVRIVHGRVFDELTVRISAAAADFEAPCTSKASLALSSPPPSNRTPSCARFNTPAATSASTVTGFPASSLPLSIAICTRPRFTSFKSRAKMLVKPRFGRRR